LQAEQIAYNAARERAAIEEQAEQFAIRRHEEESRLLALQQARLETEQRTLSETEQRVQAETQALAALDKREIAEQRAREAAHAREKAAKEEMLAARQRAELDEQENARLCAQIEQARAKVVALHSKARLRRKEKITRLAKGAGLVSAAAAFIGFSLSVFNTQEETAPVQSAEVSQPIRSAAKQIDGKVVAAVQAELTSEQVKPDTYLVLDNLKMSDQLGKRN